MEKNDLNKIFEENQFSEAEKNFMLKSETAITHDMNQSCIVSEFVLGKRIEKAAKEMIDSNEKLASSNEKYSKRMSRLTIAIVFVGVVGIIIQIIQLLLTKK